VTLLNIRRLKTGIPPAETLPAPLPQSRANRSTDLVNLRQAFCGLALDRPSLVLGRPFRRGPSSRPDRHPPDSCGALASVTRGHRTLHRHSASTRVKAVEAVRVVGPARIAEIRRTSGECVRTYRRPGGIAQVRTGLHHDGGVCAQEMTKPNPLVCTPKLLPEFRITGSGSNHGAVGRPAKVRPQPVVPGR